MPFICICKLFRFFSGHSIFLVILSLLFGLFVVAIWSEQVIFRIIRVFSHTSQIHVFMLLCNIECFQISGILNDETPIEYLQQNAPKRHKSSKQLLAEVFGHGECGQLALLYTLSRDELITYLCTK